jgi:hypothetical protein
MVLPFSLAIASRVTSPEEGATGATRRVSYP